MAMMMPGILSDAVKGGGQTTVQAECPACRQRVPLDSRFCPYCGNHIVVFDQCAKCRATIPPHSKFCPQCGAPTAETRPEVKCSRCGAVNLPDSIYCNGCGEKLA